MPSVVTVDTSAGTRTVTLYDDGVSFLLENKLFAIRSLTNSGPISVWRAADPLTALFATVYKTDHEDVALTDSIRSTWKRADPDPDEDVEELDTTVDIRLVAARALGPAVPPPPPP